MSWGIICDSSCNMRTFDTHADDVFYTHVPIYLIADGHEFTDNADLDIPAFIEVTKEAKVPFRTSCPTTGDWAEKFMQYDNCIAFTITGTLSGSFHTAMVARDMVLEQHPEKHIHLCDGKAAGPKNEIFVERMSEYLATNPSWEDACAYADWLNANIQLVFSLSSYDNLVKAGRMPKLAGVMASSLNIRALGMASPEGTIKLVAPSRGEKKAYKRVVQEMEKLGYQGGMVYIDHVYNPEGRDFISNLIVEKWPEADIRSLPTDGTCTYFSEEGGLMIGFEAPTSEPPVQL